MEKKRILFVVNEMTPFLELTKIAELTRELPQAIQEKGMEIRVFMPRFGCVNERRNRLHEVIRLSGMNIVVNDTDNPLIIKVASIPQARMQVYFLDNEDYFQKKFVFHNSSNKFLKNNDERAIFFCKGVVETVKKLGWMPDVVHCHGWMAALMPLLIKNKYANDPIICNSKVIFSVYENSFKESLSNNFLNMLEMDGASRDEIGYMQKPTCANVYKMGMQYADAIIRGSETLDPEVEQYMGTQIVDKPFLDYQSEDTYIDTYYDFYNAMLEEESLVLVD